MKLLLSRLKYLSMAGIVLVSACEGSKTTNKVENTAETVGNKVENAAEAVGNKVENTATNVANKVGTYTDQEFVTDVLKANAEEIVWMNAALNKGTDAELRSHARMMLADHKKTGKDFTEYASKMNYKMPQLDTANAVNIGKKVGKDWDEEWAEDMVDAHQKLIGKFEDKQDDVQDPELVILLDKTLAVLRTHLDMAKQLEKRLD